MEGGDGCRLLSSWENTQTAWGPVRVETGSLCVSGICQDVSYIRGSNRIHKRGCTFFKCPKTSTGWNGPSCPLISDSSALVRPHLLDQITLLLAAYISVYEHPALQTLPSLLWNTSGVCTFPSVVHDGYRATVNCSSTKGVCICR